MPGSKRTTVALVTAGAVVAGSALGVGVAFWNGGGKDFVSRPARTATPSPSPTPSLTAGATNANPAAAAAAAAQAYLSGWERSDWRAMASQLDPPSGDDAADMDRVYGGMAARLGVEKVVATAGAPAVDGSRVPFKVTVSLKGLGDMSWSSELTITRVEQSQTSWVHFTAAAVFPGLTAGERLDLVPSFDERGAILDRRGRALDAQPDLLANVVGRFDPATGAANGLQRVLEDSLASPDKRTVAVVAASSGAVVRPVKTFPGTTTPDDVRTTLDVTVQKAATKALAGTGSRSALVAIDTRTGEVRALANRPYTGIPPATSGKYAPGSTFKIVTALAALRNGSTPSSKVQCPTTITSYGKVFKNHEKAPNRTMSLTEAFADSCNTAFIGLARSLPDGALAAAAEDLGFNTVTQPLPTASFGGSYPTPKDNAELAASAIGQGRVEASPLAMASVAAAIASGTYRQPRVLPDCQDCVEKPLPELAKLRPMMRAVVTSGTGTAAAGVAGGPVYGKTGTAEFGSGTDLKNHAWFVGWQGTTAFAVFVDVGASGGQTAAPVAARFLRLLAAG